MSENKGNLKNVFYCHDCGNKGKDSFDSGDGLSRCKECSVKKYMKRPLAGYSIGFSSGALANPQT